MSTVHSTGAVDVGTAVDHEVGPGPADAHPITRMLEEASIPVTRQSWIEANWPEPPEEWSAELELQLPEGLQDENSPAPAPYSPCAPAIGVTEPSLVVQHVMESTGLTREEAEEALGGLA